MKIARPRRVTHTYVQIIDSTPEAIMPLYCPVREAEWCAGWDPVVVYSESGVVEPDCVFVTVDGEMEAAWLVTRYDLKAAQVEMVKHTPGVAFVKLNVALEPNGGKTRAVISYSLTSLSPVGDLALKEFTAARYTTMMQAWEKAMNHYLKTGELLTGLPAF